MGPERCPACLTAFTPDERRTAGESLTCKFCDAIVPLKPAVWPAPRRRAPRLPALPRPRGTDLVEEPGTDARAGVSLVVDGGPFRGTVLRRSQDGAATIRWRSKWRPHGTLLAGGLTLFAWFLVLAEREVEIGVVAWFAIFSLFSLAVGWVERPRRRWLRLDDGGISGLEDGVHKEIARADLVQVYVLRSRLSDDFEVYARTAAGPYQLATANTAEQAWWIEQEIERYFGLPDELVDGEHRRER